MRLIPDPDLNDLLLMQRVMSPEHYVDFVWSVRDRHNPPLKPARPYPFQIYRSNVTRLDSKRN